MNPSVATSGVNNLAGEKDGDIDTNVSIFCTKL